MICKLHPHCLYGGGHGVFSHPGLYLSASLQPEQESCGQCRSLKKLKIKKAGLSKDSDSYLPQPCRQYCTSHGWAWLEERHCVVLTKGQTGTKSLPSTTGSAQQGNDRNIPTGKIPILINPILSKQWRQIHKTSGLACSSTQRIIHLTLFPVMTSILTLLNNLANVFLNWLFYETN